MTGKSQSLGFCHPESSFRDVCFSTSLWLSGGHSRFCGASGANGAGGTERWLPGLVIFWGRGAGLATGPFRVHICLLGALPKLGRPVQLPGLRLQLGAWLAGFLCDANEGCGRRPGSSAFVLGLSLLEGPQRETRGPPQTQVALISRLSLTLMAASALRVWTEIGKGWGSECGPVPLPVSSGES